jgi:raffinose/stachyose/melibiose transport system substrate-binding protein
MSTSQPGKPPTPSERRRLRMLAAAAVAAGSILVAACGGGGGSSSTSSNANVIPKGPVTITEWMTQGDDLQKILPQLNREFETAHPNVTIKTKYFAFEELQAKSRLALAGNNPPDVMQAPIQPVLVGQLVKAGKLLDLKKYADKYGWKKRFSPAWLAVQGQFDPKTGQPGPNGDMYTVWQTASPLGVYYNKQKLAALGLGIPKTFDEFEADLAKAKAAGQLPLMVGNVDKWPILHYWYLALDQIASKNTLDNIIARKPGATFQDPALVQSAQLMQSWGQKGYFPPNVNSLGYDDSIRQFGKGQGVFYITGSWASSEFWPAMHNNVGFFAMPPRAGQPVVTTDSTNWASEVSAKTKYPDLIGEYMNWLISARAGQLLAANGSIPAMHEEKPVLPSNPLYRQVFEAGYNFIKTGGEVNYLDASGASILDTMQSGIQELLANRQSPDQFVSSLQKTYSTGNG